MKRCPKCGAVCSRPGQKFCSQCGAPLSQTPPQAAAWPPEAVVQRKRLIAIAVGVVVVVLLAIAGITALLGRGDTQPTAAPVGDTVETAQSAQSAEPTPQVADPERLYLENLLLVDGLKLTADGVEIPYELDEEERPYIQRELLTHEDVLLRAILPSGSSYQTTLALVSKPSNPTASFGSLTPCDAEGYNEPDADYLDAMLSVYYRSMLKAYNSRQVADLRFSTQNNSEGWSGAITMGAYDALVYDLARSDMVYSDQGLTYGDKAVTLNVAGQWVGTNRKTGAEETGTDYMTMQAIWKDGMWLVDRVIPCTEEEYNNGTLRINP